MKKKVLWLCNIAFTNEPHNGTGAWLQPLAEGVVRHSEYEIANITASKVKKTMCSVVNGITQWEIPMPIMLYSRKVNIKTCKIVEAIISEYNPDLIHIWGTEGIWFSIYSQGYIKGKCFVDIQGLLTPTAQNMWGFLEPRERRKCISLRSILFPWSSVWSIKHIYKNGGILENKLLAQFKYISTQSEWVRNQLRYVCPDSCFLKTKIMLRSEFLDSEPWKFHTDKNHPKLLTTVSSVTIPYKGIHFLIKALGVLKQKYPNITLKIVGRYDFSTIRESDYERFIKKIIKSKNLQENIEFLGPLDASNIINTMYQCDVFVAPSVVESYCLGLAEALCVGIPTVAAYSGAMPEQAENGKEALFYSPTDIMTLASLCDSLISNNDLAQAVSTSSRERKRRDNNPVEVIRTQVGIYDELIK